MPHQTTNLASKILKDFVARHTLNILFSIGIIIVIFYIASFEHKAYQLKHVYHTEVSTNLVLKQNIKKLTNEVKEYGNSAAINAYAAKHSFSKIDPSNTVSLN